MTGIALEGVTRRWGETVAVGNATLALPSGRITALVGPSGGGKTTLLMLIAGLLRPQEGRILFDGRDMKGAPPRARDIGFVFQNYASKPCSTGAPTPFPAASASASPSPARSSNARASS